MRRSAGLDLNGWHDFACRGWPLDDSEQTCEISELVDGGHASVVVSHNGMIVGGPQAIVSPIGRGGGWGEVGAPDKRRSLAVSLEEFLIGQSAEMFAHDIRAAADALTRQAQEVVLCIPDRPEMDEAKQQQLLGALGGSKRPRPTLLWRSVAMLLGWLESQDAVNSGDGQRIACVSHGSDGLEVQHLTLRALEGHSNLLAPERDGFGSVYAHSIGLRPLRDSILLSLSSHTEVSFTRALGRLRLPDDLLFCEPAAPSAEVVRRENGSWSRLAAVGSCDMPTAACGPIPIDAQTDVVLLSTPLAQRHHAWLLAHLAVPKDKICVLAPGSAARGALLAARRIALGIPHYLDRLEQISLAVLRKNEPGFEDLIPRNAIVEGNKDYISRPITQMAWESGMNTAQFYLRKGESEIRRWVTPQIPAPTYDQRLDIRLRQRPAQGWAVMTVSAAGWDFLARNPIRLDWSKLEIETRSEKEILDGLRTKPVVPERVRYLPGLSLWNNYFGKPGLGSILATINPAHPKDVEFLSAVMRRRDKLDSKIAYAIGSDGDLPIDLDQKSLFHLDRVSAYLTQSLLDCAERNVSPRNNHALSVLTWMFARCPHHLKDEFIKALDCCLEKRDHPFLRPRASQTVVLHGAGRIISAPGDLANFIPKLSRWVQESMAFNNGLGALAGMLARPNATPAVLAQLDIDEIASSLVGVLRKLSKEKASGTRLKYALMAIAGMLRIREIKPREFLYNESPHATEIVSIIQNIMKYLKNSKAVDVQNSIIELEKILRGSGGRPDILVIIDGINDEEVTE